MSRRLRSEVTPINSEISADPSIGNQVRRSFGGAHNDDPVQSRRAVPAHTCVKIFTNLETAPDSSPFFFQTAPRGILMGLDATKSLKTTSWTGNFLTGSLTSATPMPADTKARASDSRSTKRKSIPYRRAADFLNVNNAEVIPSGDTVKATTKVSIWCRRLLRLPTLKSRAILPSRQACFASFKLPLTARNRPLLSDI